jgi:hypothetical protein
MKTDNLEASYTTFPKIAGLPTAIHTSLQRYFVGRPQGSPLQIKRHQEVGVGGRAGVGVAFTTGKLFKKYVYTILII